jgi:hypothetical protein
VAKGAAALTEDGAEGLTTAEQFSSLAA